MTLLCRRLLNDLVAHDTEGVASIVALTAALC